MVKIGRHNIEALVDTGAVSTLMNESAATALNLKINPISPLNRPLVSATGFELEMIGDVTTRLYFKVEHKIGIVRHLTPAFLLGSNFLTANAANIDYTLKPPTLRLFDDLIQIRLFTRCDDTNSVTVLQNICISAFREAYIRVNSAAQFNKKSAHLTIAERCTPTN